MKPLDRFYGLSIRYTAEWLIEQERLKWLAVIERLLRELEREKGRRAA